MPVDGPDLTAFLVIQMDVVAGLCNDLGKPIKAKSWCCRSDELLARINDHLWVVDRCPVPTDAAQRAGDIPVCL